MINCGLTSTATWADLRRLSTPQRPTGALDSVPAARLRTSQPGPLGTGSNSNRLRVPRASLEGLNDRLNQLISQLGCRRWYAAEKCDIQFILSRRHAACPASSAGWRDDVLLACRPPPRSRCSSDGRSTKHENDSVRFAAAKWQLWLTELGSVERTGGKCIDMFWQQFVGVIL